MSTLTFFHHPRTGRPPPLPSPAHRLLLPARLVKQLKYLPDGILLDGARAFLDQRVRRTETYFAPTP